MKNDLDFRNHFGQNIACGSTLPTPNKLFCMKLSFMCKVVFASGGAAAADGGGD